MRAVILATMAGLAAGALLIIRAWGKMRWARPTRASVFEQLVGTPVTVYVGAGRGWLDGIDGVVVTVDAEQDTLVLMAPGGGDRYVVLLHTVVAVHDVVGDEMARW